MLRRLWSNKYSAIALSVVLLYVLFGISTEIYSIVCEQNNIVPIYAKTNESLSYSPPSSIHYLGTDYQGRDVLLRAIAGSSTALKVGFVSGAIAAVLGTLLGMLSGYFGGRTDDWITWLYSTFASMPSLLFILGFSLLISRNFISSDAMGTVGFLCKILHTEPSLLAIYLAIGVTSWVTICRVVRAETMYLRSKPYILAAKVVGVKPLKIIWRHILPNVFHLVIIYFTLAFATAVMSEGIISYLGFGAQSSPSWGVMVADGQERLWRGVWWEISGATIFMFGLVLSLNILGDALRDALDSRLKG